MGESQRSPSVTLKFWRQNINTWRGYSNLVVTELKQTRCIIPTSRLLTLPVTRNRRKSPLEDKISISWDYPWTRSRSIDWYQTAYQGRPRWRRQRRRRTCRFLDNEPLFKISRSPLQRWVDRQNKAAASRWNSSIDLRTAISKKGVPLVPEVTPFGETLRRKSIACSRNVETILR